jgi:hypothetical protein
VGGTEQLARTRRIAFLAGLGLAVLLIAGWRTSGHDALPGLELNVLVNPTGAIEVRPAGQVAAERDLRPGGDPAAGRFTIRNQTGQRLRLRLRTELAPQPVQRLVVLRLRSAGGRTLFRGSLSELRRWQRTGLELAPGQRRRVQLRAWLPDSVERGYEARKLDVALHLGADWSAGP